MRTNFKMKGLILTFIPFLLLFSISEIQAQSQTKAKQAVSFFEIRDEILKQLEIEKSENLVTEEVRDKDNMMAKFKRWEHFMLPRVGPQGIFFDPDAVYTAYKNYFSIQAGTRPLLSNSWQALGPFANVVNTNQTSQTGVGRINCIAQHPIDSSILYVGTSGGGIWKTSDAGTTWICLDENAPSMSISDLAINPLHPDTIYAATGDAVGNFVWLSKPDYHHGHYSSGIIMSADGGATWSQTGFTYQQMQTQNVHRMAIDPVQPQNILVGCDKGLFRSTDAGGTWIQLDTTRVYDIQINPLDPSRYYAITNNGLKLKRSYDGGVTFVATNNGNLPGIAGLTRLQVSSADTGKIYVIRGTGVLLRSRNGGQMFQIVNNLGVSFEHQGNYDKAIALSPVDTNVMLIGLVPLIKSVNKGATFSTIDSMYSFNNGLHVDFHELEFSIFNPNTLYAVNDGGVYVSNDIGETWTSLNNGMNITQYYRMSSSNLNPDLLLAGAQDNGPQLFDSQSWTVLLYADGMDCSFDKADENVAYASAQNGVVFRSNDGAITFQKFITPAGFIGDWITPHLANPLNSKKLFLAGNKIYASYNNGDSWQIISPQLDPNFLITSLAQSPADTLTLYAASHRNLFVTHDNGINWNNITAGLPADSAAITDLKTSDYDPNAAYVTFSGFQEGEKIYRTTDAGLTWSNISGTLPNVPFNTIVIQNNSNSDMYAGCDFGVFFKNDTMNDWVAFNSNLPGVMVYDLDINYRNGKLYAATYGRGIYDVDLITPIQPITNDAAIAKITSPVIKDFCDSLTTPFAIKIRNYGSDTLYSATVNYTIDNSALQSVTWSGLLAPYQSIIDTIATITLYGGNHNLSAYTSSPNGNADSHPINDAKSLDFSVGTAIASLPYTEGFNSGAFPPTDWLQTGVIWKQNNTVGAFNNSTNSAYANFYNVPSGNDNLSSMRIDLTNAVATPFLVFSHAYAMFSAIYKDTLIITASINCGDSWDTLYIKSAHDLATVSNFVLTPYVPSANEWVTTYFDLTAYMGQLLKIRFEAHSGFGNLLYLDDINIIQGSIGVSENSKVNINVFPNPTTGNLNISDPDHLIQNIEVFDVNGRLLYSNSSKQVHEPIDMSPYQQSLYFVKMQTVKGMVTRKVSLVK